MGDKSSDCVNLPQTGRARVLKGHRNPAAVAKSDDLQRPIEKLVAQGNLRRIPGREPGETEGESPGPKGAAWATRPPTAGDREGRAGGAEVHPVGPAQLGQNPPENALASDVVRNPVLDIPFVRLPPQLPEG